MKKAFNLIFWGYLLTMLRIEIGFDILPDPVGYIMIAIGLDKLASSFNLTRKPKAIAVALIFISIPTIVVDINNTYGLIWASYAMFLSIIQLILVYYMFTLFREIVQYHALLLQRTNYTFFLYMSVNFVVLAFMSISVNLPEELATPLALILAIIRLLLEISFIVLIRTIRKDAPYENDIISDTPKTP